MVKVHKHEDGRISVEWQGRRGRSSLYLMAAEGNAAYLNELDAVDIVIVLELAKRLPFPALVGGYDGVVRRLFESPEKRELARAEVAEHAAKLEARHGIAALRQFVVEKAGEGFNAPHDSYLREVYRAVYGDREPPSARYQDIVPRRVIRRLRRRVQVQSVWIKAKDGKRFVWRDMGRGWAMVINGLPVVFYREPIARAWVASDALCGSFISRGHSIDMASHRAANRLDGVDPEKLWGLFPEGASMDSKNSEALDRLL